MAMIGLIGGMSWESTAAYYRILNTEAQRRLGSLHSASVLIHSFDFARIEGMQAAGEWDELGRILGAAARGLEAAGAGLLLICANTMHLVADEVAAAVSVPLLHIADAVGTAVRGRGLQTVGLLGTKYTMEMPFYSDRLTSGFGLETIVPAEGARVQVNEIIYDELVRGVFADSSRTVLLQIINGLRDRGAQGVLLACTELPLLVRPEHTDIPVFDTMELHAMSALDWALTDP
jgi:aspartate racemase